MRDSPNQLRLLPAAQPLVDRLGAAFFRSLPQEPGVYKMFDEAGRLIYVGKARDLRARLNSYRRTRGQSRKTIRLIHAATEIQWELCPTDAAARLRENELLRENRPRFNRAGTWPTGWYVTLAVDPGAIRLGLARDARIGCFGAFRGGVGSVVHALAQQLWFALHETTDPERLPFSLGAGRESHEFRVEHASIELWIEPLRAYLAGESIDLMQRLAWVTASAATPFQRAFHESQTTLLAEFFLRGPQRNQTLRRLFRSDSPWLEPADLDDLPIRHEVLELSAAAGATCQEERG